MMRIAVPAISLCILVLLNPVRADVDASAPLTPADARSLADVISRSIDGRTFSVDTGKEGLPASGKDVVRFKDGLMSTALCTRFGFKPAAYSVRVEGDKVFFHAAMISDTQGRLVFNGHIEGDRLLAKAEWAQVRWYWTVDIVLWFDGGQVPYSDSLPVFIN